MGILDRMKAQLKLSSGQSKKKNVVDVEAEDSQLRNKTKDLKMEEGMQSVRQAADTILKAHASAANGQGMETRGEREKQVKAIVAKGLEMYGPDQEMVQDYISPKVMAACAGNKELAEELVNEALGEIFLARMQAKRPG